MNATYLANMNPTRTLHPDWGTVTDHYGIPYSSGTGATPQPITWTTSWGPQESDKLPCPTGTNQFCYPIPINAPIEGGPGADADADRHILYIDTAGGPDNCTLYELFNVPNPGSSGFMAASGAIFHLGSNTLRPDGWTSADAAGLPILPGLVRYDEVMAGEIKHAIRFTVNNSSAGFIHPATHQAGDSNASLPPMGLRLRLKASYNVEPRQRSGAGDPHRHEEVRHHPRRQRQRLVHHRRLPQRLGTAHGQHHQRPWQGSRQRLRGGQYRSGADRLSD